LPFKGYCITNYPLHFDYKIHPLKLFSIIWRNVFRIKQVLACQRRRWDIISLSISTKTSIWNNVFHAYVNTSQTHQFDQYYNFNPNLVHFFHNKICFHSFPDFQCFESLIFQFNIFHFYFMFGIRKIFQYYIIMHQSILIRTYNFIYIIQQKLFMKILEISRYLSVYILSFDDVIPIWY